MGTLKLKQILADKMPAWRDQIKKLAKEHDAVSLGEATVGHALAGMRDLKALVCDTSLLDPQEGIRFRGYSIPECREKLPKPTPDDEPYASAIWHLLLTGEIPSAAEAKELEAELRAREALPSYVVDTLRAMPKDTHPMVLFTTGILAMQKESVFHKAYDAGMKKDAYWDPMFEDSLTMLARLPLLAAYIYRMKFKGDVHIAPDANLDWGANFAHMMGVDNPEYKNLMRLYLHIHSDHEGGNASAHTSHLVGSTLSDAYYSVAAGMCALAGPLHGLANQEVLGWLLDLMKQFGGTPSKEQIEKFAWDTLSSGKVIPGYGHAVLRKTDPRYMVQREFALKHLPDDPIFKTVSNIYEVVPDVLLKAGKAKNPWPNVDAHSGCLQWYYGVREFDFYTVLFGVSRAMGITAQLVLDRGYGYGLERPKSITIGWIKDFVANKK